MLDAEEREFARRHGLLRRDAADRTLVERLRGLQTADHSASTLIGRRPV